MQMELRYNEVQRARDIYERYVKCLPSVKAWVRYAKFEMKNGGAPFLLFAMLSFSCVCVWRVWEMCQFRDEEFE